MTPDLGPPPHSVHSIGDWLVLLDDEGIPDVIIFALIALFIVRAADALLRTAIEATRGTKGHDPTVRMSTTLASAVWSRILLIWDGICAALRKRR